MLKAKSNCIKDVSPIEPIISRGLFDEANRILDAKSLSQKGKAKHSNRHLFSGKIKCGGCGSSYVARYKVRKDGSRYKAWRCNEAAKHGSPHIDTAGNLVGCTGLSIRNEDAAYIMYLVVRSLKYNKEKIINNLISVINSVIVMDTAGSVVEIAELMREIRAAVNEIAGGAPYEDEFYKHILDKMVVIDKDNIDVYLNFFPLKWSYTAAKASKTSKTANR